ncbi:hypothetical protein K6809_001132 [Vibrio parahaemolyticus]|nr:hypothetical protein [Vibrio parahaemolyticus]
MTLVLELSPDFSSEHQPNGQDIISLVMEGKWFELNQVPVCIDQHGIVRAQFKQNRWDCSPYAADKGSDKNQREFDFSYLAKSPNLMLQAKLIAYGWLYEQGHSHGYKCKLSTLASRFNTGLKKPFLTLLNSGENSISALNDQNIWKRFEDELQDRALSKRTVELVFTALQSVERLNSWFNFNLQLPNSNHKQLAHKLACKSKLESKQALAIPQGITNLLYGEAIRLVELAWPHRERLAQLERDLQANYDIGRANVDYKITTGTWRWLYDRNGKLKSKKYVEEINKATPQSQSEIIYQALTGTGLLPDDKADGNWLTKWRSQLQAACFVCCGAFTGMRVSELFELQADSFHSYSVDGQMFHSVRGATHKLAAGRKSEEWLASPIVEKAISLATSLSASAREQLLKIAAHSSDPGQIDKLREISSNLWLSQFQRKNLPILITRAKWNDRLKLFSKNVGAIVDESLLAECYQLNPRHGGAIEEKVRLNEAWPFITHQFRRTFACFSIRNHLGHPIALKQQFKHINLRMAEWYGNGAVETRLKEVQVDSELTKLLNEVDIEQTTATYDRWYNGNEKLSGSYGKAIMAMRDDKPVIYSNWDNLYRMVKEKRITLHGTLHSYCKNGYDCDMDGIVNPAFCVDCSGGGSIIDAEKARWWKERHIALATYLAEQKDVSPGEYAHCITQIRAAENVMRDFDIPFEVYKHPIKVVNL